MEKFSYSAVDDSGNRISGTQEADDARRRASRACSNAASRSVQRQAQERASSSSRSPESGCLARISCTSPASLGVFVKAGISIMEALEVIAEETTDKLLKAAILDMIERLQSGDTFASAAAAHPEVFPDYYLGILGSAELTGTLDVVLDQLADYTDREIEARGKITSALVYPCVVFVMAIVTVVILAAFVLPRFKTFFDSFHATLPLPTRMLLAVSNFVSTWWFVLLGGLIVVVVGAIALRRSDGGQRLARFDSPTPSGRRGDGPCRRG